MLKIAVVDDEKDVATQTERLLINVCAKLRLEAEVEVLGSGEETIRLLNRNGVYHFLILRWEPIAESM